MKSYKTTIGIEVHAELKTKSKMFCGCKNAPHASEPNVNTCPVCLGHPGTLPTVNMEAVKLLQLVGKAIGGELADYSEFDRKNYFYPDIPKAYQISQYKFPFVVGGEVAGVSIRRVHLEEDTAKSTHDLDGVSMVDFNRAGVPLMELVTEPVIHDAKTAGNFAKELQLLLRTIEVSDANMEKGEMRVEANISVSENETLGTLTEVKNLNSVRVMEAAIIYETNRQIESLEKGKKLVQETRGWDEKRNKTFSQRTKETAEDYRYFPDPDIPKFSIKKLSEFESSRLDEILPKLPTEKRKLYRDIGLTTEQIEIIIGDMEKDIFFTNVLAVAPNEVSPKALANYFVSDLLGLLEESKNSLKDAHTTFFAKLVAMVSEAKISSRVAKNLLERAVFGHEDPEVIATADNLMQNSSEEELKNMVYKIISDNPEVVNDYKNGKDVALKFLVGQGMKLSKGAANPEVLAEILSNSIKK